MTRRLRVPICALLLTLVLSACSDKPAVHEAPATVTHPVTEAEIATITLTPQAEARLGIKVALLEKRMVESVRVLGGEVVIPPGRALVVTAPVAGLVLAAANDGLLMAGASVTANQALLELLPLPPDRDIARAREELSVADARYAQARLDAERVQKLYADRLVSARDHEKAQADLHAAEATLQTARAHFEALTQGVVASSSAVAALTIRSPVSGVVRTVQVAPRQTVAAGAPLFEVEQLDRLWVRVPVYVGDVNQLASERGVSVLKLGTQVVTRNARPVRAPPSANPSAASADIVYEITGPTGGFRPGERVSVAIPLRSDATEQLVIAWSAILHDAQGGTWVYEQTKPHVYVRRRVDLSRVQGNLAILARGPAPGTVVVIEGAAELFGTEFGAGH